MPVALLARRRKPQPIGRAKVYSLCAVVACVEAAVVGAGERDDEVPLLLQHSVHCESSTKAHDKKGSSFPDRSSGSGQDRAGRLFLGVTWDAGLLELAWREERDELEEQVGLQGHLVGQPALKRLLKGPGRECGDAIPALGLAPVHVVHAAGTEQQRKERESNRRLQPRALGTLIADTDAISRGGSFSFSSFTCRTCGPRGASRRRCTSSRHTSRGP